MTNALVPHSTAAPPLTLALPEDKVTRVITQFFARRSPYTVEGYRQDMLRFAEYVGLCDRKLPRTKRDAVFHAIGRHFATLLAVDANYTAMQYVADMEDKKVAPNTINRRLSALRSFVRLGQILGAWSWTLGIRGVKVERTRDVSGPTVEQVQAMMKAVTTHGTSSQAARDSAMLSLFFLLGLRGVEVRELQLSNVDLGNSRVFIRGKGRAELEALTIPPFVATAIEEWLVFRGEAPGPLFQALGRRKSTSRGLTRKSVWTIVKNAGALVGIKAWPHGLRHSAITLSLDLLKGDVRAVQKFSRHASVETVMKYDDLRRDVAGDIATKLAKRLNEKEKERKQP